MQHENNIISDLLIVGNGITSQFLSLALLKSLGNNIKINVINRDITENYAEEYVRALSISLSTVNICKALGIWDKVKQYCYPVERIDVSNPSQSGPKKGYLQFDNRINDQLASYIINERKLRDIVAEELSQFNNLTIFNEDIKDISIDQNQAKLFVKNKKFIAKLLIAADGRKSIVRDILGIKAISWDYKQTALSCVVNHSKSNTKTAIEMFLDTGPFAILPLDEKTSSIIWSSDNDIMNEIKNLNSESLIEELNKRFDNSKGKILKIDNIGYFNLYFSITRKIIDHRLVLVGDSAHVVHPLAGQGINIGLRDVAQISEIIVDSIKYGLDFGSINILEEYQRSRMGDIISSALIYDGINKLYSNNIKPLEPLKSFAIRFVDKIPLVKKNLVEEASGIKENSPKLVKGIPLNL
ncbi:MAG: FAD-dependent monooxygenase [Hyphomicrobiales bacterium]|nr:FAD-dependent monooxygenase [Hyphomicrobiales bacterium]|tara:strand:+ start:453 stop:1688 length:1236 start_codon:yes stop_codon:yes gene_type:complete